AATAACADLRHHVGHSLDSTVWQGHDDGAAAYHKRPERECPHRFDERSGSIGGWRRINSFGAGNLKDAAVDDQLRGAVPPQRARIIAGDVLRRVERDRSAVQAKPQGRSEVDGSRDLMPIVRGSENSDVRELELA